MWTKRLLALTLFASALAVMPACALRAQWVQTNGPNSGDISAILVDSSSVVAADWDSDVFQSTDFGLSWHSVGKGLPSPSVWTFYHYGRYLFAGTESDGIFRTNVDKWLWSPSDSGVQGKEIVSLTSIGPYMVAGAYGSTGIYLSSDSGTTWLPSGKGLTDTFVHCVTTVGTIIYAGSDHGCFASKDSGLTWQISGPELQNFSIEVISQCNGILYAGVWGGGFFRSLDQGTHWEQSSTGLSGSALYVATISAIGSVLITNTDGGVYRSIDSGVSWSLVKSSQTSVGSPTLAASGSVIYAGQGFNSGLFNSTDSGQSWVSCGLSNSYIDALTSFDGELLAGEDYNTLYISKDGGANWNVSKSGINYDFVMAFDVNEGVLFAGSYDGVYRSTDEGATWSPPNPSFDYTYAQSITHISSTLIAGTDVRGMLRSTDNGESWALSNNGLTDTIIYSVTETHGVFFAGTKHTIFRSTDTGLTWENVPGLPDYPEVALFADDSLLIAGVYRSTDLGKTWILNYNSPSDAFIKCFTEADGLLFAGTTIYYHLIDTSFVAQPSGVFVSSDRGANWTEADNGLPISNVYGLSVSNGFLYAGTHGAGVWKRPLSDFGISAVAETQSINQSIQSHPNPFSQSTHITFSPESAGYADISVVNLLGEQVARIFSGELDAGPHNFTFSSTAALPDGTYECRIRMNGRVETLPIVLLH